MMRCSCSLSISKVDTLVNIYQRWYIAGIICHFIFQNPDIVAKMDTLQTDKYAVSSIAWLKNTNSVPVFYTTLTLSHCTLAGSVYTGMPLECHWLTQCTLEYHWATQRIRAGYTGTPLEKLSWNSRTLECNRRNLVESVPHWDATGETLTFAAYTGTPLEGLRQPTHARHI